MKTSNVARFVRKFAALAVVVTVIGTTSQAHAGWSWFKGSGGPIGGGCGCGGTGGASGVPEIDAGAAAGALSLLFGGVMLLRDKVTSRRQEQE